MGVSTLYKFISRCTWDICMFPEVNSTWMKGRARGQRQTGQADLGMSLKAPAPNTQGPGTRGSGSTLGAWGPGWEVRVGFPEEASFRQDFCQKPMRKALQSEGVTCAKARARDGKVQHSPLFEVKSGVLDVQGTQQASGKQQ